MSEPDVFPVHLQIGAMFLLRWILLKVNLEGTTTLSYLLGISPTGTLEAHAPDPTERYKLQLTIGMALWCELFFFLTAQKLSISPYSLGATHITVDIESE